MNSILQSLRITAAALFLSVVVGYSQPVLPAPASMSVMVDTNLYLILVFTNFFNTNREALTVAVSTNLIDSKVEEVSPTLSEFFLLSLKSSDATFYKIRADRVGGGGGAGLELEGGGGDFLELE